MNRLSTLVAVLVLSLCIPATSRQATPRDEAGVRNVVTSFAADWNRHDMDAFGKLFALDADFVNVAGILMRGRSEIQNHHAWAHGAIPQTSKIAGTLPRNYGIFKNSTMQFDTLEVRFLRSDVALAHVSWKLSGDSRLGTPRHGIFLFVLTRGEQGWQIATAQNTEINRTVK